MTARALMIQGTGSDVGKSLLVAALCRIARQRGINVAPFKPQNMSNNAAACEGGGEIGRAQALQALAAGIRPAVDHNPVLLKPETDRVAQVVVRGQAVSTLEANDFINRRDTWMPEVMESFLRLANDHELVIVEGAGSPSEINLRDRDIANMGFARTADVPVCLLGDIERGGVIANIVGTRHVLDPGDAAMIRGFVINKFRGDISLFDQGVVEIETRSGWPCFGVIPWLSAAAKLPAEDAISVLHKVSDAARSIHIVAPMLSRIANVDDADPLRLEPGVDFEFIAPGRPIPRNADLIILFGSKSTLGDMEFLRSQGWDHDVIAHARAGGQVLGICGGYQMLGNLIVDDVASDGCIGKADGLGLLNIDTQMTNDKTVRPIEGVDDLTGNTIDAYEIHVGQSDGPDCERPMLIIDGKPAGACNAAGNVYGCYFHGLMISDTYRAAFLEQLGVSSSSFNYSSAVESALDELAHGVESALDIEKMFAIARTHATAQQ